MYVVHAQEVNSPAGPHGVQLYGHVDIVDADMQSTEALSNQIKAAGLGVRHFRLGNEYLRASKANQRGCTLISMRLPDMSGLDLYNSICSQQGRLTTIFSDDWFDARDVARVMRLGAFGIVVKPYNADEIRVAIRDALRHDVEQRRQREHLDQSRLRLEGLTRGEHEVLGLMMDGRLNKQIAGALSIAVRTVENRRARIMSKLGVRNIVDLTRLVVQTGFVPHGSRNAPESAVAMTR